MSLYNTRTRTQTNTYTESRAHYVMGKAYEDFTSMYLADLITKEQADNWRDDILYLMRLKVLDFFEVQFFLPDKNQKGIRYKVSDIGYLANDNNSGGTDFYSLPTNTQVNLLVRPRPFALKLKEAMGELEKRGWGRGGNSLSGHESNNSTYSKENYGLNKSSINW